MKQIVLVIGFFVMGNVLEAQKPNFLDLGIKSNSQYNIYQAISPALYLVESSYVLIGKSDSTKEYGYGGNVFFGKKNAFGINIDGRIHTIDDVFLPWKTDTLYKKYEKSDSLHPKISQLDMYSIMDSTSFELNTDSVSMNKGYLSSVRYADSNSLKGVDTTGDIEGWMIIIYNDTLPTIGNRFEHKAAIYENTLKYNSYDNNWEVGKMPVSQNIVGGLFVVPIVSTGIIRYQVLGMIEKKLLSWRLITMYNNIKVKDDEQ